MKALKYLIIIPFTVAYGALLSLGFECLLNLLSISFAISLDGGDIVDAYPRFIPFCIVAGLAALALTVTLIFFNVKAAERLDYSRNIWHIQAFSALVISFPMIKLWEMLFDVLHAVF